MGHSKTQQTTIIALLALTSFAAGCNDSGETGSITAQPSELVVLSEGDFCQDLLAGQTTDAGDVCLTVDGGDLVITYTTTTEDGWLLGETHLWAGTSIADMPQTKKGNPKIGNFPYSSGSITPTGSYEVRVPLSEFGLNGTETECDALTFYVAAHAVVGKSYEDGSFQTETGWAAGDRMVARGSWATFFSGEFICTDDGGETGDKTCETAFAMSDVDATCFLDIDDDEDGKSDFKRWGWTNGPLGAGAYTFDIYAGAGQCDTNKGTFVGTLSVVYDGSTATVSFDADPNGTWTWEETHLYIGNETLPVDVNGDPTVAPGQYTVIHDDADPTNDSYTIDGLTGDIYVVAHAVSCTDGTEPPPPPTAEVAYYLSEFVGSGGELWPGTPSDFKAEDTRRSSLELNTIGGLSGADQPFEAGIVTLRNGTGAIVEQKQMNRRWPPALNAEGCNDARSYPECWIWGDGVSPLLALLPDVLTGTANTGFDTTDDRVYVEGGMTMEYPQATGFTDDSHRTFVVSWVAPEGKVLDGQLLFRGRYDHECNGLGSADVFKTLFLRDSYTPSNDVTSSAVQVVVDTATLLTIEVNVQAGLEAVRDAYLVDGLSLPGAGCTP